MPVKLKTLSFMILVSFFAVTSVPLHAALATLPTGGSQPHNNYQPSLGLNHIIALQGVFPEINGSQSVPTLGEVQLFAGNFAPRGWAFANGQELSIAQNSALFSLIGTTYGGDGESTFKLPDLRGRTVVGTVGINANTSGLTARSIGDAFGNSTHTLTSNQIPTHRHDINNVVDDGMGGQIVTPAGKTFSTGGGASHPNIQPSFALHTNLAPIGIFPSPGGSVDGDVDSGGGSGLLGGEPFIASIRRSINQSPGFTGNGLPADGRLLPIAQNTALFSLIGTIYGGDGETNFALPDARGRAITSSGNGPGLPSRTIGSKFGAEDITLTIDNLPPHSHSLPFTSDSILADTGSGNPHENHQPTITLNYMIRLTGIFPSQNGSIDDGSGEGGGNAGVEGFIGEVALFAGNFAPRGWTLANGQLLHISQNQALFSILGTTFGGDGETTFGLPDLRGRVPVHPGADGISLGHKFGSPTQALTIQTIPSHAHDIPEPTTALILLSAALTCIPRRQSTRGIS